MLIVNRIKCVRKVPMSTNTLAPSRVQRDGVPSKFESKWVRPAYGYPSEYQGPKPVEQQIQAIAEILGLNPAQALEYAKNLPALPKGAEGWFAIPSVNAVAAKYFPDVTDPAEKYCQAIKLIHQKIAESRIFHNGREGQIDRAHLRNSACTLKAMKKIAKQQKGDIFIIAAQLGKRWGGYCVGLARDSFVEGEFGLTSFAAGSIILVHPERFSCQEELDMDCPGDEFSNRGDGQFDNSPSYRYNNGRIKFDANVISIPHEQYGPSSGYVS